MESIPLCLFLNLNKLHSGAGGTAESRVEAVENSTRVEK